MLDAQTRQPIKGVQVQRVTPAQDPGVDESLKGGQAMQQAFTIRSGGDGRFVVAGERDFTLFRELGWYSVSLSFDHPGYDRLVTHYTLADSITTPKGEPLVNAGDILLQPTSR